jgi:hypothetical protein
MVWPRNSIYLVALGALSLMTVTYEGITYWHDLEGADHLLRLSALVFLVLLVLWVDADSRTQPKIYRPFEYGLLALFYWAPYLPYYFWRTRGAKGLLMFAGIICLLFSGWLVQWLIYMAANP